MQTAAALYSALRAHAASVAADASALDAASPPFTSSPAPAVPPFSAALATSLLAGLPRDAAGRGDPESPAAALAALVELRIVETVPGYDGDIDEVLYRFAEEQCGDTTTPTGEDAPGGGGGGGGALKKLTGKARQIFARPARRTCPAPAPAESSPSDLLLTADLTSSLPAPAAAPAPDTMPRTPSRRALLPPRQPPLRGAGSASPPCGRADGAEECAGAASAAALPRRMKKRPSEGLGAVKAFGGFAGAAEAAGGEGGSSAGFAGRMRGRFGGSGKAVAVAAAVEILGKGAGEGMGERVPSRVGLDLGRDGSGVVQQDVETSLAVKSRERDASPSGLGMEELEEPEEPQEVVKKSSIFKTTNLVVPAESMGRSNTN